MLQMSSEGGNGRGGILLSPVKGFNDNADSLHTPGESHNAGRTSSGCKELGVEFNRLTLPSKTLQQGKGLNRKRRLVNGNLLLQWGHRKRPRIVKGAVENSVNNTMTKMVGNRIPSMRWQSTDQRSDLALRSCAAPELGNGTGKCSINEPQGRSSIGGQTTRIKISVSIDRPDLQEKCFNLSDSSNDGRPTADSLTQGRTEEKSSDKGHAIAVKIDSTLPRWPKISICLSRKQKDEDFLIMKGTKLPQRPKRRSKQAEKALQYVSPGAWLPHLTRDRYEVRERTHAKKRPRGLKEMDSMGSDSE